MSYLKEPSGHYICEIVSGPFQGTRPMMIDREITIEVGFKGQRGRRLMRKRGELIERSFAHGYETGAMRRTHLRRHDNIAKRLLVHIGGFNLSLVMRQLIGTGKPRRLRGLFSRIFGLLRALWSVLETLRRAIAASARHDHGLARPLAAA